MPVSFPTLTKADACALLREIGLDLSSDEVETEQRDDRWLVSLPGQRMAWLPVTPQGAERLAMDRKLLRLLEQRCSFQVPRVLLEFGPGCDVRAMVPGIADPFPPFARVKRDSGLALRLGRSLGRVLAEQHENIRREDVIPWLRTHVTWPESGDWIRKRLPRVTDDGALRAEIERALRTYEDFQIPANDLALVHGDFGLHNVSIDPAKDDLLGVFDYDGAAWDDRHHDFRYLLLGTEKDPMLDAALDVYETETGVHVDRRRVFLYNAVCAISFLAFRDGIPADTRWCGRTLPEDLRWVRQALDRLQST